MKKVIYSMEQLQELVGYLDTIVIAGIENCKRVALISKIIDSPLETIEEKEGE